jgi:hypothetical protein
MSVFFEHFKTLEALCTTIEKRPINNVYKGARLYSQSINKYNIEWTATKSYAHSNELIKNGYHEPLKDLKKELTKLNKQNIAHRKQPVLSVTGTSVNVPRAMMGLPRAMYRRENTPQKKKTIHLMYGFSAIGSTGPRELIKGGTMFLSLVNMLEKQNFRVKIDIMRCTTSSNTSAIGYTCTLKEYNQPLNLLKLCYPLVNPSMLRRTSFRWMETLPDLKDRFYRDSYGQTLYIRMGKNSNKEREFLKANGVLKKDMFYINVYEAMDCKTVEELAKKAGIL